jgi:hypothetical protein
MQYELWFWGKQLFGCGQVEFWARRAEMAAAIFFHSV